MMTAVKFLLAAFTLLVALTAPAQAMGGMYSAKYVDGPNLALLTHNVHTLQAGVPATFNLRLYDMEGQPIAYSKTEVKIQQNGQVHHQSSLQLSENGDVSLQFSFPSAGNYTLYATFVDNDKQIAKSEFPLTVEKNPNAGLIGEIFTIPTASAFILGVGVATLFAQRRHISWPKLPRKAANKKK